MRVWDWVISRWFGDRRTSVAFSRSWRAGAVLVLLCLTVYLPGLFTIPPIDRDESRFAQASRQMFEAAALPEAKKDPAMHSGGWVVPMLQDKPRLNKPPLVYWLQVASAWAFTGGDPLKDEIWMYRIPGVLCAIATVLMTWRMGRTMFDPRAAFLGAALLAVCPLIVFDAHQARADQLLLTTVVATQWALWSAWRGAGDRSDWAAPLVFWACLGVSILSKGPIGPMIAALTCLALSLASRRWRWLLALRPALGLVIVVAIVGPWLYAVGEHVGWAKYLAIIKDETIGRSLEPKEGHWGPPGYHTVLLAVLFWPGSLTTAMAVGRAFKRGFPANPERERRTTDATEREHGTASARAPGVAGRAWYAAATVARRLRYGFAGRGAEIFCLAWIVPAWIVFELIGTKLPHYTMPMYPAVALLSGRAVLSNVLRGRATLAFSMHGLGVILWQSIGIAMSVVPVILIMWFGIQRLASPLPLAAGVAVVVFMTLAFRVRLAMLAESTAEAQALAIGCAILAMVALSTSVSMPSLLWTSVDVMRALAAMDPEEKRPLAMAGYGEDSLVYLTRGRVRRIGVSDVPVWMHAHPRAIVVVRDRDIDESWLKNGILRGPTAHGFNYATGRAEALVVLFGVNP